MSLNDSNNITKSAGFFSWFKKNVDQQPEKSPPQLVEQPSEQSPPQLIKQQSEQSPPQLAEQSSPQLVEQSSEQQSNEKIIEELKDFFFPSFPTTSKCCQKKINFEMIVADFSNGLSEYTKQKDEEIAFWKERALYFLTQWQESKKLNETINNLAKDLNEKVNIQQEKIKELEKLNNEPKLSQNELKQLFNIVSKLG